MNSLEQQIEFSVEKSLSPVANRDDILQRVS